jgi:hypothetical protein
MFVLRFLVSFCLFISGCLSNFVGSDRSIEYPKTIPNKRTTMLSQFLNTLARFLVDRSSGNGISEALEEEDKLS